MYTQLLNFNTDKKDKIINAALRIFTKTSYKKASTDEIVVEAGISKGALFHYFKSKLNLYLYVYDYVTDIVLKEFYGKINFDERDMLERFRNVLLTKLTLVKKYPDMFNFMVNALNDDNPHLKNELQNRNSNAVADNWKLIIKDIDRDLFRDDIDVDIAINMIFLTFEAYGNREVLEMKRNVFSEQLHDKWIKDFDSYVKIMRKIYYKGE